MKTTNYHPRNVLRPSCPPKAVSPPVVYLQWTRFTPLARQKQQPLHQGQRNQHAADRKSPRKSSDHNGDHTTPPTHPVQGRSSQKTAIDTGIEVAPRAMCTRTPVVGTNTILPAIFSPAQPALLELPDMSTPVSLGMLMPAPWLCCHGGLLCWCSCRPPS